MEYSQGGSVERMRAELVKSGAIQAPDGTVPPPAPGVTAPTPAVPVGSTPAPETPGAAPQPGAVEGQTAVPAPAAKPKTGDPVQGEAGPNGEPLFYVLHDGIESKMTVAEMATDHSYKSHNTRVGQENADKRRDLDLRETQLLARETAVAASGAASFDALLNGVPDATSTAPVAVAPPVVVPPAPPVELAVENPDEYARLMATREQAQNAHNDAVIAASVKSVVEPLAAKFEKVTKAQEDARKQDDMQTRMDVKMVDLQGRIPGLDMNLVKDFLARSSNEDVERWNHPDGYELVWGKIQRGEQPGGIASAAVVPPMGAPPQVPVVAPIVYPATPPVAAPPFAEPGAGAGRVTHATPAATPGGDLPNMTTPEAISQALKDKRAITGPMIYAPHGVAR